MCYTWEQKLGFEMYVQMLYCGVEEAMYTAMYESNWLACEQHRPSEGLTLFAQMARDYTVEAAALDADVLDYMALLKDMMTVTLDDVRELVS